MPGCPVEGSAASGKDELDAAGLVDVTLALHGSVPSPLLAAQPLDEVLDRGFLDAVKHANLGVDGEVLESFKGSLIPVLGPQSQVLHIGDGVEKAFDHLLGTGT